jgi:hypothetical protein
MSLKFCSTQPTKILTCQRFTTKYLSGLSGVIDNSSDNPLSPNRLGDTTIMTQQQDFPNLPTYRETTNSNESWVVVTLTKTDSDGSTTQTTVIEAKPR